MNLEIDADTAEETKCTSRQNCGRRRGEENSGLRSEQQESIRSHPGHVTLIGEAGEHETLHTRHRQRLHNTGAGSPKRHEGQNLRYSKRREAKYFRCADRRPEKPEKETGYLEKDRS